MYRNSLFYYVFMILIGVIFFQIFWPLIVILGLVLLGGYLYLRYKQAKIMKSNMQDMYQDPYTSNQSFYQETSSGNKDVIDVEYTEHKG